MQAAHFPALAAALRKLFGPSFSAEPQADGLGFRWRGRDSGSCGALGMEQDWLLSALSTAHDVVLEGMGEDGEHPGLLVQAQPAVLADERGWRLRLLFPGGEVKETLWPL